MRNKIKKIIEFITGYWIYKMKDLSVGVDLIVDLKRFGSNPCKIIFDVGANVGQTAMEYSSIFKNAKIYSFEPVETSFKELTKNVAKIRNVSNFQIAFGSKKEEIKIELDSNPTSLTNSLKNTSASSGEAKLRETIRVRKIDDFVTEHNIKSIDLLKIDTEGWELEVLKGASQSLAEGKIKLVLCEAGFTNVNSWHTPFDTLNSFMSKNGFWFCGIYDVQPKYLRKGWHYGNVLWFNQQYFKEE